MSLKKVCIVLIIIFALLLVSCGAKTTSAINFLSPSSGLVNFNSTDLDVAVSLDSGWLFYWQKFIDPAFFYNNVAPSSDAVVNMPSEWKSYKQLNLSGKGYCTWAIKLVGLEPNHTYAIKATGFMSAAHIYANGKLVQKHGTPANTANEEKPASHSLLSPIMADDNGVIALVMHASNFIDRSGGTHKLILFGDFSSVLIAANKLIRDDLLVVGALLAMAIYFVGFFAVRREEYAALWFGILCALFALRVLCYGEYFFNTIIPIPWLLLFKLGTATYPAIVIFAIMFVASTYKAEFPSKITIACIIPSLIFIALIVISPPSLALEFLPWYQIITLLIGLALLVIIIKAVIHKQVGARLFVFGFLVLFITTIYDILVSAGIILGVFISQIGLLVFLFMLSIIITKRFSNALVLAETMSKNLVHVNKSLERFVPKQFLGFLNKNSIEEIVLGDSCDKEMALLFVDIMSFTQIAESLTPEQTFIYINDYLANVSPAVRLHGGFIDKYLGDGFMALFPGGAESALLCAMDIQSRIALYNADAEKENKSKIVVGIGANIGHVMIGTIGEELRMDGTVLSDAVNVASRLEGVSKKYGLSIAATETIIAKLPNPELFRMRFIGRISVHGKSQALSVFDIYEGDPPHIRESKDSIRVFFEKGIHAFYNKNFNEARVFFNKVLMVLPNDKATLKYIMAIEKHYDNVI